MSILSTARINASTIQNQAFANLYNLINTRSNVPDPTDLSGARKFVHVRPPRRGRNFPGFPFIVIDRIRPVKGISTVSLTKSFMSFDSTITVYSQDKDSDSDANQNGAEQNNLITDNIIKTLNNATNQKDLINNGMSGMEYNIDTDVDDFEGRTVFTSEFDIRFERSLTQTT